MLPSPLEFHLLSALKPGPRHGFDLVRSARQDARYAQVPEGYCYEAIYSSELRGWICASQHRQSGRRPRIYRLTDKGLRRLRLARWTDLLGRSLGLR